MSAEEIRETRVAIAKHAIIRASEILMEDGLPGGGADFGREDSDKGLTRMRTRA